MLPNIQTLTKTPICGQMNCIERVENQGQTPTEMVKLLLVANHSIIVITPFYFHPL